MNLEDACENIKLKWIDRIPSHWMLCRVGKFFTERSEKVDDKNYPPLSVTMSGVVNQLSNVAKTNDGENRKLVKKNDLVINSRSDRKGSSGIAPRDGSVSLINIVLEPHKVHAKFILHLFKSYYFMEEYFRNGKGIHWDLWTTRWEYLKNINIPIPPPQEQKLISQYLDNKTEKIDLLIKKVEKKIELLNEYRATIINEYVTKGLNFHLDSKDSGAGWIGKIPDNWKITKFKYIFNEKKSFKNPNLNSGSISFGKVVYKDDEKILKSTKELYQEVLEGEFLINPLNLNYDLKSLRIAKSKINAVVSQGYIVLRIIEEVNSEYYEYLLRKFDVIHMKSLGHGVRQTISFTHLKDETLVIPPIKEQEKIVIFLKEKTNLIDKLCLAEHNYLKLLSEYRQSLLSSIVSGSFKITEDMI
jgi:type I restriction enzyme, S subunit